MDRTVQVQATESAWERDEDQREVVAPRAEPRDSLTKYLGETHAYDVLSAAQERAVAQRIEALEVRYEEALLADPEALPLVIAALHPHLRAPRALRELNKLKPGSTRAAKARHVAAIAKAARSLRKADVTRLGLPAADAAVRAAFAAKRGKQGYLKRLDAAKAAHQQAKNAFMTANLRLVVALARRYDHGLLPLVDLIQEGNLGLVRAVERFDHRRGFRFSTYASWWIRHGFNRALSDKGRLVRLPVHLIDDLQGLARARVRLRHELGHEPTLAELSGHTGMTEERIALLDKQSSSPHPLSFDRPIGEDGESTLLDMFPDAGASGADEVLDQARWEHSVEGLLAGLSSLESDILRLRFGLDGSDELTLQEIGERYNLSRERIRQLQVIALQKLRATLADAGKVYEASSAA